MDNMFCDLNDVEITEKIDLNETQLSILICGLTLYKENLERLKSKTEYICKEIRRTKALKKKLQSMAINIEVEYEERAHDMEE